MPDHDLVMGNTLLPVLPAREEVMNPARRALDDAKSLKVDSDDMYTLVGEEKRMIKGRIKLLEEKRMSFTRPLDAIKKQWMAFFDEPLKMWQEADGIYEDKLLFYKAVQDKKRAEAEKIARDMAEGERRRLEEMARTMRVEALEAKDALTKDYYNGLADTARMEAELVATPVVNIAAPKVAGISTRFNYSAKVVDLPALVAAIASGKEPYAILDVDAINKGLSALARLRKDEFKMTGCELIKTEGLATRGS